LGQAQYAGWIGGTIVMILMIDRCDGYRVKL
jgi:hypothetical protein